MFATPSKISKMSPLARTVTKQTLTATKISKMLWLTSKLKKHVAFSWLI